MSLSLPTLNAMLNATSALLLLAGFACIRAKRIAAHAACMIGAFIVSTAFLISYLTYHAQVGSVRFLGTGWIRPVYFAILLTHTILAIVIVPLILRTLWLAARRRFRAHRAIARWTFPLWLYVSVSGVVVYWMLYRLRFVMLIGLGLLVLPSVAMACPLCKEALADPTQVTQRLATAKAYALSIGVLLAVPVTLITSVTLLILRAHRLRPPSEPEASSSA
jgi:uncharacterized membrane protein YozB (DUF420 family)